ncbi:MAG: DUF2797 domain-containing protein [Thermoplasmatota archaeon]
MPYPPIPFIGPRDHTLDGSRFDIPYHVLGHTWVGDRPGWSLLPLKRKGDDLFPADEPIELGPSEIGKYHFRRSLDRYCVGRFPDGEHVPCPYTARVGQFPQCPECMSFDIPDPRCIFEPHCNEDSCGAKFCKADHVVYVTSFRGRRKVGMTQLCRVEKRGREQGADLIFPLLVLGDRYSARVMENMLSEKLGIPQALGSFVKLKGWSVPMRPMDQSETLLRIRSELRSEWPIIRKSVPDGVKVSSSPDRYDAAPIPLSYPLEEPLESAPRLYRGHVIRGDVIGFKGNYMIFRSGGIRAFRIGETPGEIVYFKDQLLG